MNEGAKQRPVTYDAAVMQEVLRRIMEGQSLREVCRAEDMPARSTIYLWLADNKDLSDQYARACEVRADEVFDEMFDIADNGSNDWIERNDPENPGWRENGEAIRRAALRIDARKWALARMSPRKYGDKTQLEHSGPEGGPIETKDATPLETARRVAFVLSTALKEAPDESGS